MLCHGTGNNCFFTENIDLQLVNVNGAVFHNLIPSFMNTDFLIFETPFSTKSLSFQVLMLLSGLSCRGLVIFRGHSLLLDAFQISVSFMLAFN